LTNHKQEGSLSTVKKTLFYLTAAIGVLWIIAGIYFLIPGIYHPYLAIHDGVLHLIDGAKHPAVVRSVHRFYALASFAFAAVFIAIAFLGRPKQAQPA